MSTTLATAMSNLYNHGILNTAEWSGDVKCAIVETIDANEYKNGRSFDPEAAMQDYECQAGDVIPWTEKRARRITLHQSNQADMYLRRWQHKYCTFVESVLGDRMSLNVIEVTEIRATMVNENTMDYLPFLHHAFLLLKLEGGSGLCIEKYNDGIELIFAEFHVLRKYALKRRAEGGERKPTRESKPEPTRTVSLQNVMHWIDQLRWQYYDLKTDNCQKFAQDMLNRLRPAGR